MWKEDEVSISNIETLLNSGYEVEVDSPDGYVPVTLFVDKGEWEEYVLILEDDSLVRVNENHLFETTSGWVYAKDLLNVSSHKFITRNGVFGGTVVKTGNIIPIVDINVDHPNHRYYTNGVSSHNTNVGKSLFMCHVSAASLLQGKNVLYITMEMAEERIAERIDANMMNVGMDMLKVMEKDSYLARIKKLKEKTNGKLIIKEYPTATAHAGHFRSLLEELKIKRDFSPDLVCIDYLNICNSQRLKGANVNSYSFIKSIAEELRGLAVEYNLPILTATQTTRSGYASSDVDLTDTSESFGLPATADFMFALISTEELEEMNQIMVKQLKSRYGDPNYYKRFVIGIDRSKMKLYDVEEAAQNNISDSGQSKKEPAEDVSVFDNSSFGKRSRNENREFGSFKF